MSRTSMRGLLAVSLLAGLYVLIAAIVLGIAVFDYLAITHGGGGALKLAFVLTGAGIAIIRGVVIVDRNAGEQPRGVSVGPEHEPIIWQTVARLADDVGTRAPDEIRLVPEVNAFVSEDSTLLGLRPKTRRMYIGLPLLLAYRMDELEAVLAHELGHYSRKHTRFGAVSYRGAVTLGRLIHNLEGRRVFQKVFLLYAEAYWRVSQAVRREQELEADREMVAVAGRQATMSALGELRPLAAGWELFLGQYVAFGLRAGVVPQDIFGGFQAFLADPRRREMIDEIRRSPDDAVPSPYDSHPTIAERLVAVARYAEAPGGGDGRPAYLLLADVGQACRAVQRDLLGEHAAKPAVSWEDLGVHAATAVAHANGRALLDAANRALTALGFRANPAHGVSLGTVLELIERGHVMAIGRQLVGAPEGWEPAHDEQNRIRIIVAGALTDLVGSGLAELGRMHWRLSWASLYFLADLEGRQVELRAYAESACTDPSAVPIFANHISMLGLRLDYAPVTAAVAPQQ